MATVGSLNVLTQGTQYYDGTSTLTGITGTTGLPLLANTSAAPSFGILGSAGGGTGVNNGPSTITLGGNLTLSGAFATTITVTASTSVTLPTSGTLVGTGSVNTYTAQQTFSEFTLTDAASIAWNLNTAQSAVVTLTANRTLANPTNQLAGGTYILRVVQDGSGSHTLAYGANYKWPQGIVPILSVSAGAVDILTFYSDGTNMNGVANYKFS